MDYNTLKTISTATPTDVSRGYAYTSTELNYLVSKSIDEFPFGTSEYDVVETTIMSADKSELFSYAITSSGNYIPYTKSFIDVNNNGITYNYELFSGDFVVIGTETRSLFIDVAQVFKSSGITQGTYLLGLNPVRYIVGSPTDLTRSLIVREISPSRTEISISPTTSPSDSDINSIEFNSNYIAFGQNKIQANQVITQLLRGIESPSIYNAYYDTYSVDSGSAESAKYFYSFLGDINWENTKNIEYQDKRKSDAAVVQFITDIYYGVKRGSLKSNGQISSRDVYGIYDQFKNTLFQNYNSITTFSELRDLYYSLFSYILNKELNQITNTKPINFDSISGFFQTILYDKIFIPVINKLEVQFDELFSGYLKNSACFSFGLNLPILNYTISSRLDAAGNRLLLLKFPEPIPTDIKIGSSFWITNFMVTEPVIQSVYLYAPVSKLTTQLRGPNFLLPTETIGNGTANSSIEDVIGVTGSLYSEIISKLNSKYLNPTPLNVDYRYFENFIKFSSAETRVTIFYNKFVQIENLQCQLTEIEYQLSINPLDDQYIKDRDNINAEYNSVESSMDGYENFLYNNQEWYYEHSKIYNGISSASLYDRDNSVSLQNTTPEYIRENESNSDYVTFINMIGHYFDNLSAYITQFTQKNNSSNSLTTGISSTVVYSMLSSLGWEPEIGRENLPLILSTFSKSDFDVSSSLWNMVGTMSETERNQAIWKRLLNNLPFILKAKGTSVAINSLANCYGIPQNILSIKEYGGIENDYNVEQNSVYSFTEEKYSAGFMGSGEYFNLPWSGSFHSVEFNVSFDPKNISEDGQVFRIVNCSNQWIVGVVRERGLDWGRAFFTIRDSVGNLLTSMTPRVPIFNGDMFTVVLRKNDLNSDFLLSPYYTESLNDSYPRTYDLNVLKSDESRITYEVSSSILLSGSYNTQWKVGSEIFFGNYLQNTSSFSVDPEAFFGTLDEIKLWEIPINLDRVKNHSTYQGAYDSDEPINTIDKSLVRISFGTPIDLHTGSGIVSVKNLSYRSDFPYALAVSFPAYTSSVIYDVDCNTNQYVSEYPFQFKVQNVHQHVRLPNFGSNKFRSNKINYTPTKLVSNLSPTSRSTLQSSATTTVDSNKLGIFFSPSDSINAEIIKFFGNFEFGDLIGSPADVYLKNYPNFEKFRKLYFDQGGGQLDYQTFINMIRAYFDKSLFKYAQNLVPARTKTVSGILIEPTILERPKIQQKPPTHEIHRNLSTLVDIKRGISGIVSPKLEQSIEVKIRGISLYDDYNRAFYNNALDPFGFVIYAEYGISYYNDDFYRVDIVPVKRSLIVESKHRVPLSQATEFDIVNTDKCKYQIISQSYESINTSRFPVLYQYPITSDLLLNTVDENVASQRTEFTHFSGSIIFTNCNVSLLPGSQTIDAEVWSIPELPTKTIINGFATSQNIISGSLFGIINSSVGVNGTVDFNRRVLLSGSYNSDTQIFDGRVIISSGTSVQMFFYTTQKTKSIFTVLRENASGTLFDYINQISYTYRKNLSFQNIPYGSRLLDGYYSTHYRYKKQNFSRKPINIVSDSGNFVGTFKKGLQTQKTTVQQDGLLDNSPPIVITKTT